jgi:hypothetical protein
MLSTKFSTNPESFIKFGRGRRIDLATSHGYTHIARKCETRCIFWYIHLDQHIRFEALENRLEKQSDVFVYYNVRSHLDRNEENF